MQANTLQLPQPSIELQLPQTQGCSPAIRVDLDHLLLAIEAIDLQATEVILELVEQLALNDVIPNRVSLWRMRNTNPYRRNYQRGTMTWQEAKAIVVIICHIARRINTHLRLLVITSYQASENKIEPLGLQNNLGYLNAYLHQFHDLFLSRMRSPSILNDQQIQDLGTHLLTQLLFCSGSLGEQRLWSNLIGSKK
ncbi:Protein of unknown function (DUF3038) [Synechococcus sp. PCC 7502]|uniref:DUF3038 domain-containing protein n=1 Tax=Synechococcus sp. PCC 7502 TaxID=1173263 RepID=UPI00029FD8E3|nr:DUF3038 domain-containing protein [Synechococcus sp. PCC 7502]AFY73107.1 Protein of unknown function (DUF3038) [Synechococcus sp. PCC 7502]